MYAANQVTETPWFFQRRPVQYPYQVDDACRKGEISILQFHILLVFHRRVDWETGTAESLAAEQVIFDLRRTGLIPAVKGDTPEQRKQSMKNHIRSVQKQMESLRKHGWFHDDYQEGTKRPYTIWLYEHHGADGGVCMEDRHTTSCLGKQDAQLRAPKAPDADESTLRDADKYKLTPLVGTHCHPRLVLRDADEGTLRDVSPQLRTASNATVSNADGLSGASVASVVSATPHTTVKSLPSLPSDSAPGEPLPPPEPSSAVSPVSDSPDGCGGVSQKQDNPEADTKRLQTAIAELTARKLKITKAIPRNWDEKFRILLVAHPIETLVQDFSAWCDEPHEPFTSLPIIEYSRVMDARLGQTRTELKPIQQDPRVEQVSSLCYELTGVILHRKWIPPLLAKASVDEVMSALKEYVDVLNGSGVTNGVRRFFSEGGAEVVITARRNQVAAAVAERDAQARQVQSQRDSQALQHKQAEAKRLADAESAHQATLVQQAADAEEARRTRQAQQAQQEVARVQYEAEARAREAAERERQAAQQRQAAEAEQRAAERAREREQAETQRIAVIQEGQRTWRRSKALKQIRAAIQDALRQTNTKDGEIRSEDLDIDALAQKHLEECNDDEYALQNFGTTFCQVLIAEIQSLKAKATPIGKQS